LNEVRGVATQHPGFREALADIMQEVISMLSQWFSSMAVKKVVQVIQVCIDTNMKKFGLSL